MAAAAVTVLILLLWLVQGLGVVQWLAPDVRRDSVAGWIAAIWIGLLADVLVLANLYFLIPGCTIGAVAWPATLVIAAGSVALYAASPRPRLAVDLHAGAILVLTAFATLLVLRPLAEQSELGFYFSNNGEFANYAAIADAVQFHGAATPVGGPLGLISREAVIGVLGAQVSVLTGEAALWIIQPLAAALAALAFASLGVLLRHAARRYQLGRAASGALVLIHGWAILSAATQCFWTLSFVSQYLSVALLSGGIAVLAEARELTGWRRMVVLGGLLGALVFAYPEMTVPNAMLLAGFELAAAEPTARARGRAALAMAGALAIALVVTHRIGYGALAARGGVNVATGWPIYGPHRPVLGFVASVTGLTNTFAGPATRHALWPIAVAAVLGAGLVHSFAAAVTERIASLRGLYALAAMFVIGLAGLFWIVVHRGLANNYIALKFILGYGWLAYLAAGLVAARLIARRPRALPAVAVILLVIWVGLAGPAVRFTRQLHRATREALFLESEGRAAREALGGARAFVAAGWANYAIIGRFLAHDRDLVAVDGRWPDGTGLTPARGQPMVVLGTRDYPIDPELIAQYRVRWRGTHFVVMEPEGAR